MKCYFNHYGKEENNFAQIIITDEYDEKTDVINIESISEEEFKKLWQTLIIEEKQIFIYKEFNLNN